jgi:FKBP-type peptidyl-prolyl cis-trans isomerase
MLIRPPQSRRVLLAVLATTALCGTAAAGAVPAAAPPEPPAAAPDVASYDVGLLLGGQLEHDGLAPSVSVDALVRGLRDGLSGRTLTIEERDAALQSMRAARDGLTERNSAAAREFLDRNGKESGVVTMPSGLQYRVLAAGDAGGKTPGPTDQVTVRYRARLADGTEFDRSDTHKQPATFRVNSVLKAWREAFLAMKPGATWQLFVPPELGYGANSPPAVPPGALLVYELELLRVEPTEPAPVKPPPAEAAKPHAASPGTPH